MQVFCVVEFLGREEVDIISSNWLFENRKKCYWPPFVSQSRRRNAVKSGMDAGDDWMAYDVKVLYNTCKYKLV